MNRKNFLMGLASLSSLAIRVKGEKSLKKSFRHSVCRWCYQDTPLEEMCQEVKKIGIESIELTGPEEWKILHKYGLTCAMGWGDYPKGIGLDNFYSNPENHEPLAQFYEDLIPKAKNAGVEKVICLSGKRMGLSDEQGLENCAKGIQKIIKTAEKNKITVCMELLNSRVDHKDHLCDRTAWGVELCKRIDSENFKLLYDIYHMQIMEGDLIRTIRDTIKYIAHFHTAGNPGRHEIDDSQEINYKSVMKAIADTGFKGFVSQEFIPSQKGDFSVLKKAVEICSV